MATLEQQRRAIGAGITAARKATGGDERKAIGQAMIARRRGEQQVQDINAVVQQPRQRRQLSTIEPRGALVEQKGRGNYVPPRSAPGGGGVASPLIEDDYDSRMYWSERTLLSSDGLLSFVIRPIQGIFLRDANNAPVEFQFAQPPVEEP